MRMILCLLLSLLATACGDTDLLRIQLVGVSDSTVRAQLSAWLDDQPLVEGPRVELTELDRPIVFHIPHRGQLRVLVQGFNRQSCRSSDGRMERFFDLGELTFQQQTLELEPIEPALCRLDVDVQGAGEVVYPANPDTPCGAGGCSFELPAGSSATLQARKGNSSDVEPIWESEAPGCKGRGECAVSILGNTSIRVRFPKRICQFPGWCVVPALPVGSEDKDFTTVWGSGPTDLWVAGTAGQLLHFDGLRWQAESSPVTAQLNRIWGTSSRDIWAVGDSGTIIHYDGARWQSVRESGALTTQSLTGFWGDTHHSWTVGPGGEFLYYDGQAFTREDRFAPGVGAAKLTALWGSSGHDVWAVGLNGTIAHFDGNRWSSDPQSGESMASLYAIWGSSQSDIWAVGAAGARLHYNGKRWIQSQDLNDRTLLAIHGADSQSVWTVGEAGTLLQRQYESWARDLLSGPPHPFAGVWVANPFEAWAVADKGLVAAWQK